ncbi:MAG: hypothetical protein ACRD1Y_11250 [Terriglobales bacterium]
MHVTGARRGLAVAGVVCGFWLLSIGRVRAQAPAAARVREPLAGAWWTGPLLAPSAATLPRGHFLVEPYLYDVAGAGSNDYGSLSYWIYGLTDNLSVGMIPTFDYQQGQTGTSSSSPQLGDASVEAQYRLMRFRPGHWVPDASLNLQETFPTGPYTRLGNRPGNGTGAGAHTTTVSLYTQTYWWLPNGRILRVRWNFSQAFSSAAPLTDVSVYGTGQGFRGEAQPGDATQLDWGLEYSLTQHWVLANDVEVRWQAATLVHGSDLNAGAAPAAFRSTSSSTTQIIFAPAAEYNFNASVGLIWGMRIIELGRNFTPSLTPVIALNFSR